MSLEGRNAMLILVYFLEGLHARNEKFFDIPILPLSQKVRWSGEEVLEKLINRYILRLLRWLPIRPILSSARFCSCSVLHSHHCEG